MWESRLLPQLPLPIEFVGQLLEDMNFFAATEGFFKCFVFQRIPRSASNLSTGDLFIPSTPARESHDLLLMDEGEGHKDMKSSDWMFIKDKPLETCYDLLCDSYTFQVRIYP